jgi:hypothetical protein
MLRKIVVGGFVAVMIAAVVIGIVQLAAPAAEAQGRGTGRAIGEGAVTDRGNGGSGRGGGSSAVAPDAGSTLGTQGQGRGYGAQTAAVGSDQATAERAQSGQGRGYGLQSEAAGSDQVAAERLQGSQGQRGQGGSLNGTGTGEPQAEVQEWVTVEGTVVETAELAVETAGETVQIGLGPSHYREGQGFVLSLGDQVRVSGYWEDGEFKAGEVENLSTGLKITLRDAYGRPMWSGQGRRSS